MKSTTITFRDLESNDEALAIGRHAESSVGLCLSLMSDGDIEVFMRKEDARRLLAALQAAVDGT